MHARFCSAVLTALLATACGSGGSHDGADSCGQSGAYREVLGAMCDWIDRCPDSTYPIAYRDRDECIAIMCFALTCRLVDQEVGGVEVYGVEQHVPEVDPADAAACAAWLDAASCDAMEQENAGSASPCANVMVVDDGGGGGSAQLGDSCENQSCDDGLFCAPGDYAEAEHQLTCRVCEELPGVGEPCSPSGTCAEDAYCTWVGEESECLALEGDGSECTSSYQCASGFCNPGSQTCDPDGELGDDCSVTTDCRGGYCSTSSHVCEERKENGEPCGSDDECANTAWHVATGVCGLPNGDPCSSYADYQCASGNCDDTSSTCQAKKAIGSPCEDSTECVTSYCDYNTSTCQERCYTDEECEEDEFCDWDLERCLSKLEDGNGCDDDDECVSGYCNFDDVCQQKPGIGDECSSTYDCYPEGYCANNACAPRLPPGAGCEVLDSCAEPFLCIDGRCRIMNIACRPAHAGELCAYFRVCDDDSYCDRFDLFTCKPRKGIGEACGSTEECTLDAYCAYGNEGGECTYRGGEGAECQGTEGCLENLYCVDSVCDPGPVGMPCDRYDAPCPGDLFCNDYDVCEEPRSEGEDCDDYYEPCAEGLYCDTIDGCLPPHGLGEECGTWEPCAADLYCASDYTCQPAAGENEACDYPNPDCGDGLYCESGTYVCVAKAADGEPCTSEEQCLSGVCDYTYGCLATEECLMP